MPKLTKRLVEGAEIRPKDYFLWCDALPCFGVRILPSGKRSYLVQYRAGGRSRRAVIGLHGPLTVEQARRQAMALLAEVAKGGDPAEERATRRTALTVGELCDRYVAAAEAGLIGGKGGQPKKASTLSEDRSRIKRHIQPLLGRRLVRDLTHADVARFIRDVATGKTAAVQKTAKLRGKSVVRGGRGVASRAAGLLGGIFSFAASEGVITHNPATGVRRPTDAKRTTRLSPADYEKLGRALATAEAQGVNRKAIAAARLIALTGCRKNEIVALRWEEVDEAGRAFRLRDSKEGASVRPVGSPAFDVLATLQRQDGDARWVLPGERRALPYGGWKGAWREIARLAELKGVTAHTLRHSFASVAGDLGFSESTIAAMLGHAAGTVTGRYTHHLDTVLIAAADRVAKAIDQYMAGKNVADPGSATVASGEASGTTTVDGGLKMVSGRLGVNAALLRRSRHI